MALVDTEEATKRFMELLESGFYNIDDRPPIRGGVPPYSPEKEERDTQAVLRFAKSDAFQVIRDLEREKEAVREFVNSDAFGIIREIGGMKHNGNVF